MWALWPFFRRGADTQPPPADDEIRPCGQCLLCVATCPTGALAYGENRVWSVDLTVCIRCRSCAHICPNDLIGTQHD